MKKADKERRKGGQVGYSAKQSEFYVEVAALLRVMFDVGYFPPNTPPP